MRASLSRGRALSKAMRSSMPSAVAVASFAAALATSTVPGTSADAHRLLLKEPVTIRAALFGGALQVTCELLPGAGSPWRATAALDSLPIGELAAFFPGPARSLRGGAVSGHLAFEGLLDPPPDGMLITIAGTLTADSLRWSQSDETGSVREWVIRDLPLDVRMSVHGDPARPLFSGSLGGTGGTVEYLGRQLPVSFVQVSFMDSTAFDPVVDLAARAPVISNAGSEYLIRFDVVGPISRARPEVSSSPELTPQDIETLLALGVPLSAFSEQQLAVQEGSYWAQQVFLLRALEVAADRIVGLAEDRAEGLLGLDEVRMPMRAGATGGLSEIELAKRLGRRATLTYTSPVWHSSSYRVRLEMELGEHLSLESESDQTGDAGVDLRFKKRLR
jgi:hypothetical protein